MKNVRVDWGTIRNAQNGTRYVEAAIGTYDNGDVVETVPPKGPDALWMLTITGTGKEFCNSNDEWVCRFYGELSGIRK